MIIHLSPQRRDDTLEVIRSGDVLTLNGEQFDLSQVQEGDTLPATAISSGWFASDVDRTDGELIVTLILPLPANYSPEQAFPVPIFLQDNGVVPLPQPLPDEEPEQ